VVIHQSGAWLYTGNKESSNVSGFSIDPTTGTLSALPGSPYTPAGGTGQENPAIDTGGKFLYTANFDSNDISVFNFDQSTGVLTNNVAAGGATMLTGTNPIVVTTAAPTTYWNNVFRDFVLAAA
jgi:6-phosphogluconolactonase (cycloisomerase 2 family)